MIASVFVNPTQFNNPTDLATYPRKEEDDFKMLAEAGVSAVFAPSVEEMYPGDPKLSRAMNSSLARRQR